MPADTQRRVAHCVTSVARCGGRRRVRLRRERGAASIQQCVLCAMLAGATVVVASGLESELKPGVGHIGCELGRLANPNASCVVELEPTRTRGDPLVPYGDYTESGEERASRTNVHAGKESYLAALVEGASGKDTFFAPAEQNVQVVMAGQATALVPQPTSPGITIHSSPRPSTDGVVDTGRLTGGVQPPPGSNNNRWWGSWVRNGAKVARLLGGGFGVLLLPLTTPSVGNGELPQASSGPVRPFEVVRVAGSGALLRRPDGSVFYTEDRDVLELVGLDLPQRTVPPGTIPAVTPDRDLQDYMDWFGSEFVRALLRLGPDGRWLDSGSARSYAVEDFLDGYARGRAVALALDLPSADEFEEGMHARLARMVAKHGDRVSFLFGRTLEGIEADELGTFQLVTDALGPATFSNDLTNVIERYGQVVAPGGLVFLSIAAASLEFRGHEDREDGFRAWLDGSGFEITRIRKGWGVDLFMLTRTRDPLAIPKLEIEIDSNADNTLFPARVVTVPP